MNPWFISCEISYVHAVFSLLIRKAQKYPVLFPYHPDKNIIAYSALIYNERWMYQILLRFLSGKRSIKYGFQSKKLDKSSNKPLFIGFFRWHPTWHFYLVEVRRVELLSRNSPTYRPLQFSPWRLRHQQVMNIRWWMCLKNFRESDLRQTRFLIPCVLRAHPHGQGRSMQRRLRTYIGY